MGRARLLPFRLRRLGSAGPSRPDGGGQGIQDCARRDWRELVRAIVGDLGDIRQRFQEMLGGGAGIPGGAGTGVVDNVFSELEAVLPVWGMP